MYSDQRLTCIDCNADFVFTAGEQKFFEDRNFTPPKRCKACRAAKAERKAEREVSQQNRGRW